MGDDLSGTCAHLPARLVNLVALLSCLSRNQYFSSDSLSLRGRSKAKIYIPIINRSRNREQSFVSVRYSLQVTSSNALCDVRNCDVKLGASFSVFLHSKNRKRYFFTMCTAMLQNKTIKNQYINIKP